MHHNSAEYLEKLEKYFKDKFGEYPLAIPQATRYASFVEDLDQKIESIETVNDDYKTIRPKRNTSVFNQKCKHCNQSSLKEIDRDYFLKHNSCYLCYVTHEELRNGH